jgi:NAD-dependent SIR2 family protein deacetylase
VSSIARKELNDTVVILGAGFSVAAKLPTTAKLLANFSSARETLATPAPMQAEISRQLKRYWSAVFGWTPGRRKPAFEDHFTSLDLAANTGHQLGGYYAPRQLRAIRRLSLHRVFETLDLGFKTNASIRCLTDLLAVGRNNTVVTTNWDIVVERHLRLGRFHYGIPTEDVKSRIPRRGGLPVLKLHGSANWCYCDDCRRVFTSEDGKSAYKQWLFVEKRDFEALDAMSTIASIDWSTCPQGPRCPVCEVRLSARVATFSFDKALGFFPVPGNLGRGAEGVARRKAMGFYRILATRR